jgi:superfamily II DNA or RNA helicase/RNA polymerase subunit RPABC4/transcription elongation factor Spt4
MTKKPFVTSITPYPYQQLAIEAALKGLRGSSRRALVVMATGLGKTITAAFTTKKFKPKKILFLAHNNFILEHAESEFRLVFGEEMVSAIYNGMSKDGAVGADFVFATWQTMGRNLKQWSKNYFDLIIVDEAHHSKAKTYEPVVKYFSAARLGITATPDREDEQEIREIFGDEVINITLEEAIAKGWLPPIEYHVIMDESLDEEILQEIVAEIKEKSRRFTMAEVNRRLFIRKRDEEISKRINAYLEKTVVFCASIGHAERMADSLGEAETLHSNKGVDQRDTWNKNQEVLRDLKDGTIRRVCVVDAFNEGVNVPSVGLVAFCRVTDSVTVFRQQLGRGLRPGKEKLIVLDFVGNLERIRLILAMVEKIKGFGTPRGPLDKRLNEKFEVSGAGFQFTFSDEIVDLMGVLQHVDEKFYETWEEAAEAARRLEIKTSTEYFSQEKYKQDERLPASPARFYSDFPGWHVFLKGEAKVELYPTWQEASEAARVLGITTQKEYKNRRKDDSRLPSNIYIFYSDFPGWHVFLKGEVKVELYPTWQEASEAAIELGIVTGDQYKIEYKKNPRLPSTPWHKYSDFPGWEEFLKTLSAQYSTCLEASLAARNLGITTKEEYAIRYKEDPLLPSTPRRKYGDFPGWHVFLKGEAKVELYPTWQEASEAAKRLGITTQSEYRIRYKEDQRLPSDPGNFYSDFPGLSKYFGKDIYYPTWQEASEAAKRLGIKSGRAYKIGERKKDVRLHSAPDKFYSDFPGWPEFLGKKQSSKS